MKSWKFVLIMGEEGAELPDFIAFPTPNLKV